MKYTEWMREDALLQIEGWARDGLTDEQMCQNMGISKDTFYRWKSTYSAFSDALKKGKAPVDIQVENALLKRALGYEYEETVTEIVEEDDGSKKKHIKKTTRHIPPDTTAQIFWLKNRRPDKWRDRIEQSVNVVNDEAREKVQNLINELKKSNKMKEHEEMTALQQ